MMSEQTGAPPDVRLLALINGFQGSMVISVAATVGLADALNEPRDAQWLSAATGTNVGALTRLLGALAGVGIVRESPPGSFALTEMGQFLRKDVPGSVASWAEFVGSPYLWNSWGDLVYSIRTGEPAFDHLHGEDVWDWRSSHPGENLIFNEAMRAMSFRVARSATAAFDFGRFARIIDIGGGNGAFLAAILANNPSSRGVVFDLPHVVAGATAVLREAGVSDRCEAMGGSYFDTIPGGGDAYIVKAVFMDHSDDEVTGLLRKIRSAMLPNGEVLIVERIITGQSDEPSVLMSDMMMLLMHGTRIRRPEEWLTLLEDSGFRLNSMTPLVAGNYIIRATPFVPATG